jgi:hypothetical protein
MNVNRSAEAMSANDTAVIHRYQNPVPRNDVDGAAETEGAVSTTRSATG